MKKKNVASYKFPQFLTSLHKIGTISQYAKNKLIFRQGDPATCVFFIHDGRAKITVVSGQGKGAVVAVLDRGAFCGEGCLSGQPRRMATARAMTDCEIIKIEKEAFLRTLKEQPFFSALFVDYLLKRAIRVEEDLIDQLFNSSEKRLARALLLLANFGQEGWPQPIGADVTQETLAEMIGTTRSRVNFFMNRFRKLGFVSYNGTITIHSSLLNVVLNESAPHIKGAADRICDD
jgi:CRP/FNR family cyclic AMP-dependent transcriptional regulator